MDLDENRAYCLSLAGMRISPVAAGSLPHYICPSPLMLMIGDMMGGIMVRIFGENKNSKNSEKTADYENRPVKFVMERKNVWRVVWAD